MKISSVFYAVRKMEQFKGKNILIAGGGDSALDWFLNLQPNGSTYLPCCIVRLTFRAAPDSVAKMREFVLNRQRRIVNRTDHAIARKQTASWTSVTIKNTNGDQEFVHACDTLLPFFGLTMKLGPIADFGLNLNQNLIPVDTEKFQTATQPVFSPSAISTLIPAN